MLGMDHALVKEESSSDQPLLETDVRDLVRLLGATASLSSGGDEKRGYLLDGFCALIGADGWSWMLADPAQPGFLLHGGPHGAFASRWFQRAANALFRGSSGSALPAWHESEHLLFATERLGEGRAGLIALLRRPGRPAFTSRETCLARIVLSEIPWLFEPAASVEKATPGDALTPREQLVLEHLIAGRARKEIAGRLGISPHTVSGYLKKLFRHFGVRSQTELLRRCLPLLAVGFWFAACPLRVAESAFVSIMI